MPLELEYVLSGEGVGSGKEEGQALIQCLALLIPEPGQSGVTWFRDAPKDCLGNQAYFVSRYPNNADATKSGRGGDGGDGVCHHGLGFLNLNSQCLAAAFSILLVMYHCWAMDSRLLTTQ